MESYAGTMEQWALMQISLVIYEMSQTYIGKSGRHFNFKPLEIVAKSTFLFTEDNNNNGLMEHNNNASENASDNGLVDHINEASVTAIQ